MLLVGYKRFRYQIFRLIRLLSEGKLDYRVQDTDCNGALRFLVHCDLSSSAQWLVVEKIQVRSLT